MSKCSDKHCPHGKLCNPASGRCVKASGEIGKKLVRSLSRGPVPGMLASGVSLCKKACSPLQTCNPASGRCVLKTSKIGKGLVARSAPEIHRSGFVPAVHRSAGRGIDLSLIETIRHSYGKAFDKFVQETHANMILVKKVTSGRYGVIYIGCEAEDKYDCRVIKVQKIKNREEKEELLHEIEMQNKFSKMGLAPKIYRTAFFTSKSQKFAAIEMDKIDGTLQELLEVRQEPEILNFVITAVMDLLDVLCSQGVIHGDLHDGNLGYVLAPGRTPDAIVVRIMVIDFGMSCCIGREVDCNMRVDLLQFMRSFGIGMDPFNAAYLYDYFYKVANNELGLHLPPAYSNKAWEMIDRIQDKAYQEYMNNLFDRDL